MYIIPHPLPYSWEKQKTKHKQKKILRRNNFAVVFVSKFRGIYRMPCELRKEVVFIFLQLCVAQHIKKNLKLQVVLLMEDEVQDDGEM